MAEYSYEDAGIRSCRFLSSLETTECCPELRNKNFRVVTAVRSSFNDILILDTPGSRILLLDSSHNIHSMVCEKGKFTGSYWDEFATLPPVVPDGPIAIFGLGGGTAAHLILDIWPALQLEGWEIDSILVDKSREHFGLSSLEQPSSAGGVLKVHIGDVFSPDATFSGRYAGIIVDLFMDGKVLPQLEQADTWLELCTKLMPNGRLMVNCGAGEEGEDSWKHNATIRALCEAFPGQVCWKKLGADAGENYIALTGCVSDLGSWAAAVPPVLSSGVHRWRSCS